MPYHVHMRMEAAILQNDWALAVKGLDRGRDEGNGDGAIGQKSRSPGGDLPHVP